MKSIIMLVALVCAGAPIKAEFNRHRAQAVVAEKATVAGKKVKQALSNRKVQAGLAVVVAAVALQRCVMKLNRSIDREWAAHRTEQWHNKQPVAWLEFYNQLPWYRRIAYNLEPVALVFDGWFRNDVDL